MSDSELGTEVSVCPTCGGSEVLTTAEVGDVIEVRWSIHTEGIALLPVDVENHADGQQFRLGRRLSHATGNVELRCARCSDDLQSSAFSERLAELRETVREIASRPEPERVLPFDPDDFGRAST